MHLALLLIADDRQPGGRVWRFKSQRSVRTVLVVVPDVDPKDLFEWRRPTMSSQSRHSARTVRIQRSAYAFARGARTGVTRISAPSSRTKSSKARENFTSWSRSK